MHAILIEDSFFKNVHSLTATCNLRSITRDVALLLGTLKVMGLMFSRSAPNRCPALMLDARPIPRYS